MKNEKNEALKIKFVENEIGWLSLKIVLSGRQVHTFYEVLILFSAMNEIFRQGYHRLDLFGYFLEQC